MKGTSFKFYRLCQVLQLNTCITQNVTVFNLLVLICSFVSLSYLTCISLHHADLAETFRTVHQLHGACRSCSWFLFAASRAWKILHLKCPVGTMTWRVRIGMFSFTKFQPNRHYMYSFQTIALRSLAFLMFYCYFFMFLSLIVIPITILIMFTIDYVMPIILPNITPNNCNLNLFVCFSMVYTRVKLSLIVMLLG